MTKPATISLEEITKEDLDNFVATLEKAIEVKKEIQKLLHKLKINFKK